MMSSRLPYSFPRHQNDDDFSGQRCTKKEPYSNPTHLAQTQDPWNRLNKTCTLTSSRREVYHYDPQAPTSSIDFVLKSQYDQHSEFLKAKHDTLIQPETLGLHHGRVLKNRVVDVPPEQPTQGHPLRVMEANNKETIHSVKNAIEGHHTQTTNRGYSRKPDGGFFTA